MSPTRTDPSAEGLPRWAYVAALASLRDSTRLRLDRRLREDPQRSWIESGGDLATPRRLFEFCRSRGIAVVDRADPSFPAPLRDDIAPPSVLFVRGDLDLLDRRRVAVVGTRSATRSGRYFARTLARDLTRAGVAVVSGLARGVDGEAHEGALAALDEVRGDLAGPSAGPIAVVASGLDVVYPPEHRRLWDSVAERGLLLSESPPGAPPEQFRFPQRNRIIAALAEIVVVVESGVRGGSMLTVREASLRGIDVMAVPGAPSARTSAGTNALLRDGCAPVTDADDVLLALGLTTSRSGSIERRPRPVGLASSVLHAMGDEPVTVEELSRRTASGPLEVAVALGQLQQLGWVERTAEWWEALIARR